MLRMLLKIMLIFLIVITLVDFGVFLYLSPVDRSSLTDILENYLNWSANRLLIER